MHKWNEQMDFDFSKKWSELSEEEWSDWVKKTMFIEEQACRILSQKYNVDASLIREVVSLDSKDEWEAVGENISDQEWINAVVSVLEDELKRMGYLGE